jgi:hypothetical protein
MNTIYRITAVFGDYYIGGRQFDRLETLISYYMYYSELVKGEKLLHPVVPPIVRKLDRTFLSIKPYPNFNTTNQTLNKIQYSGYNIALNANSVANYNANSSHMIRNTMSNSSSHNENLNLHVNNNEQLAASNGWNNNEDILYFDKIGERFKVFHEIDDSEWLWAQSCETNECGLLNADSVICVDDDKLHEIEPWYYSNITKEDAANILASRMCLIIKLLC